NKNLSRAAVELAKDWRTDRFLRRLEALLVVADRERTLILSGTGDVVEPDDGVAAIGSGGPFAQAAAVALLAHSQLGARQVVEEGRPKNSVRGGPTGVGKTEIARRLARLAGAPFVKVEASKFTEIGYVGKDVDSMIRDLVEAGVALVREERQREVQPRAEELA